MPMYFNDNKVTVKDVYEFFSTRFDMRKLPKGVKLDLDENEFYCFIIGLSEDKTFTCVESIVNCDDELEDNEKEILEETLKATPGLYELFMSSVQSSADSLLDKLADEQPAEVNGVIKDEKESDNTVASKQNTIKQKTWRFFENNDAPGGVDAYIYMSSKIVREEELAAEMFRIIRDYDRMKGIEIPNKERMSIWTLKDFFDNHILESPEAEMRIKSSLNFEEAFDRVKFWVDCAWEKITTSGVIPLMERPVDWLEDDSFFKEKDKYFEDIIKNANERRKEKQQRTQKAVEAAVIDRNDNAFKTKVGMEVLKFTDTDNAKKMVEALEKYVKQYKEDHKNDPKFDFTQRQRFAKQLKAIETLCDDAMSIEAYKVSNEFYNPEGEDKAEMEQLADAALEAYLSGNWD